MSWTNDGSLSNPGTVNIRGPRGLQGVAGSQGPAGPTGPAGTTNYNNLTNKPVSDTSLKLAGGFADAKATGEALDKRVGVAAQTFTESEKSTARSNIGVIAAVESYLVNILKQLCLDNGATQAEIDALEAEETSESDS
ncbi:collagen-like triple helix repeat-containing protein [Parasutterella excrementihominis]|uniref:collagen-like triple helix repeat-containing protein n=1 Tax=Parasutterella excrementihominis TaxID=487175 RepID=UPI0024B6E641|nr:collagen-like protein [Parasutterella excrementihominis]